MMIAAMMCYATHWAPLGALAPVLGDGLLLLLVASVLGTLAAVLLAMGATQPRRPAVDATIWWPEREQAAPSRDTAARPMPQSAQAGYDLDDMTPGRWDEIWGGRP